MTHTTVAPTALAPITSNGKRVAPDAVSVIDPSADAPRPVDVALIDPNPWQPRLDEDPEHVASIAASLREQGPIHHPVLREMEDGRFQIAVGHTRIAAHRLNGTTRILASVRPLTDRQMSDWAAAENARRKDLSGIEKALFIKRRMEDFGLTQLEAARPLGYEDPGTISNLLRLLKLPEETRSFVQDGSLPERLARQLVGLSDLDPQAVTDGAKEIIEAEPGAREAVLRDVVESIFRDSAKEIRRAAFPIDWPAEPIPVQKPKKAQPTELRACQGCPFNVNYSGTPYCTRPTCYELKQALKVEEHVKSTAERLGLPVRSGNHGRELERWQFSGVDAKRRLLAVAKTNESLGVVVGASDRPYYDDSETLTGNRWVGLFAPNPRAVAERIEKDGKSAVASAKAQAKSPDKKKTAEEEAAADARRAERASANRYQHDLHWLMENTARLIAARITIGGGALLYTYGTLTQLRSNTDYPVVDEALEAMRKAVGAHKNAITPEADKIRLHHWLCNELAQHAFGWFHSKDTWAKRWKDVLGKFERFAGPGEEDRHPGFQVKLPAGWDTPPIHHTAYNCWHCGTFASQRKLSKRDLAEGWVLAGTVNKPDDVCCPRCAKTHAPHPKPKVAAKAEKTVAVKVGPALKPAAKKAATGR